MNPDKRYTITQIRASKWFKKMSQPSVGKCSTKSKSVPKRSCAGFASQPLLPSKCASLDESGPADLSYCDEMMETDVSFQAEARQNNFCFSQPANIDDMFVSTQTQMELCTDGDNLAMGTSQSSSKTQPGTRLYLSLVKRMTRFFTNTNFDATMAILEKTFQDMDFVYKKIGQCQFTITMVDKHRMPLIFRSSVNEMNCSQILVDFRLTKGDGIEFKRQFLTIKHQLKSIIVPTSGPGIFDS